MGKSNNIFGAISGKIGGTLFYRRKNSNFNQGTRAYVADVKNPKTMAQARQRMVMKAVQNLYAALAEIINRAYQSTAYGNPSRIKFLGNAMRNFQGPWLEKGSSAVIPFAVNIAEGTLGRIAPVIGEGFAQMTTNIAFADTGSYGSVDVDAAFGLGNVGDISKALLNAGGIINAGDQVTIVRFLASEGSEPFADVVSFIVDPASVETIGGSIFRTHEGNIVDINSGDYDYLCASAFILSREGVSGQHMRSTSPLVVNAASPAIAQYFSDAQFQIAIASYMDSAASTDWPVEPSDDENIVKSYVNVDMSSDNLIFVPTAGGEPVVPTSPIVVTVQGYRTPGGSLGLFEQDGSNKLFGYYTGSGLRSLKLVNIGSTQCHVKLNTENPGDVRFITLV